MTSDEVTGRRNVALYLRALADQYEAGAIRGLGLFSISGNGLGEVSHMCAWHNVSEAALAMLTGCAHLSAGVLHRLQQSRETPDGRLQ